MFFHGTHKNLIDSIEAIGAGFAVYEHLPTDNSFILVSCNNLYEDIIGKQKEEALNSPHTAIFPRYIGQPMLQTFQRCKTEQLALESEILIEYKGEERYWRSIISPILESKDGRFRIIQTCVEITEKKILERKLTISMKRFEAVVQSAYDGIITIDSTQKIKLINEAAQQIFGYSTEEIIGEPLTKLLPPKYREKHAGYVEGFKKSQVDSRPMQTRASVRGLRKNGSEFPIEVTISKIKIGNKIELTAVIRDISEKNRLLEELLITSQEDCLTGLFNRRHFTKYLTTEMLRFKRFKRPFCLIMIDIDHFKGINDTYGHECGDLALTELAKLIKQLLRETDRVGRWGGEEFLVLLPETILQQGLEVAEKLRLFSEKMKLKYENKEVSFTISAGVQEYNNNAVEIDQIINAVDKCLYRAKSSGRNQISAEK